MSTVPVAADKPGLRVIAARRRQGATAEFEGARADALFFRAQTLAIVRHFFEIASQIGRLPSILGREFFRARVSHHAIPSFEEQAVFVHDVERALGKLSEQDAEVVALVGLFQYSLDDVATMLGRSRGYVVQRFADSVDSLAEMFLQSGLLREDRPDRRVRYFAGNDSLPEQAELPPKNPAVAVPVESFHEVGEESGGYSFLTGGCKA